MKTQEKSESYEELVKRRKACRECEKYGFINQAQTKFDTDHIGNYSTWAHDLDADIMVVAQDYANLEIFNRDEGKIQANDLTDPEKISQWDTGTNYYLWKLLLSIGRDIGTPVNPKLNSGVFLTNAVLDLKQGEMNGSVPKAVYNYSGKKYLKPLIDLVQPKVIIALGTGASQAILNLYQDDHADNKTYKNLPFGQIFKHGPFTIQNGGTKLIPIYHPGALGQANRKKIEEDKSKSGFELMMGDWEKIVSYLK